jgi:signal transduction histidine kinase/CheY-like chemotaxis protein/HPt (histidine-containing phosphotransfer) domain-containing protein
MKWQNLSRAGRPSVLAGMMIFAFLALLWAGFAWLTITEYSGRLEEEHGDLYTAALAYADYAALLSNAQIPIPLNEQKGAKTRYGAQEMARFARDLHLPEGTQLFLHDASNPEKHVEKGMLTARAERRAAGIAVVARRPVGNALEDWRRGALAEAAGLLAITLLMIALGNILILQLRKREAVEHDLVAAKEMAEAGSRAKSDFLANMSHEVRTPLNGVLGMADLLLDTALNAEQRRFAETIHESGEALLAVVNDILDVSKLEAGKLEIDKVEFDLVTTVENAVGLMSSKAREKQIDLGVFIEPQACGAYIGDPLRLRQILLNLLSNAIKFTDKGGVSVQVNVRRVDVSDLPEGVVPLRFEVADSGIGISESMRLCLFQKFTQIDGSATRRFGGTGLGLAICRQLVELMGGKIDVVSRLDQGSTFWFELALVRTGAAVVDRDNLHQQLKSLRALMVDDVSMNLDILGRQLRAMGMEAAGVEDGFAAMAELERAWHRGKPYDILFLDQMMPGMSGTDMARRIRTTKHLAELKLVLVSSAGREAARNLDDLKLDYVLEKPVRQQDLLDCLISIYRIRIDPVAISLSRREPSTEERRKLRVLLAEDNRVNQQFAEALLRKAGHSVDIADNGVKAVDAVHRNDYDVVLMDIQMPEMDGVEATRQIRKLPAPKCSIPIIAMTADAMSGSRETYLKAGMDDYISKPIQPTHLLARLAAVAGKMAPTSPKESVNSVLDMDKLQSLDAVLDRIELDSFVKLYLTDTATHLAAIAYALPRGDLDAAARSAHVLISTAGNIGATEVSAHARRLVDACRRTDRAAAGQEAEALASTAALAQAAFEAWIEGRREQDKERA